MHESDERVFPSLCVCVMRPLMFEIEVDHFEACSILCSPRSSCFDVPSRVEAMGPFKMVRKGSCRRLVLDS